MNENQQEPLSTQTPADLLAQLIDLESDAALSYLTSRQLATAETAAVLVSAALEQAESAARAAGHWLNLATQLNRQSGNLPALDAQILYAQARLHLQLGDLQEAESAIYRAQSFWQKLADNAALARSYLGLTQILALQGRFNAAENAIRQAIELLPPDSIQRTWAYTNLANLLDRRGEYASALASYEQAQILLLRLRRQAQAEEIEQIDGELAELQLNRANVLVALDRPDEAEEAYTRALEYFITRQDVIQQGRLTCNLGSLYLRTGRYADALRAFDKAEESLLGEHMLTLQSDPAQLRVADILLLDQANAYLALNLHNEAMLTLERCQTLFRSADQPYELAQSLYLLGLLHLRHHDLESSQHCLHESYQLFHTLNNYPWRNRAELALAEIDAQRGHNTAAATRLDHLLASLSSATVNGLSIWARDLSTTIEASLLRLQLSLLQHEFQPAQQLADQIDALLNTSLPLPHLRQRLAFARGSIALAQQQFDTARSHFYAALHMLEDQRMSLPLEEFRTAYLADKYHIHAGLVLSLLHRESPGNEAIQEAFTVIERARARSLHERMQTTTSKRAGSESPRAAVLDTDIQNEQGDPLYEKLHWFYNQIFEADPNQPDLRQELQHYENLLERISWKSAQPQGELLSPLTTPPHIVSLAEFQRSLGEDQQALLYYIVQPSLHSPGGQQQQGEVMAFLVERERVHLHRRLCTPAQLTRAQTEFRFQVGRVELGPTYLERHRERLTSALRAALHELYNLLIAPLAPALHKPRLLLIPYGPLHLLPFHALWDGERHLIECFTCSYAPSAGVTVHFTQQDQPAGHYQSFAGLALSDPAIPQARREVELAAQAFPQRQLFLDEAASRAGLSQAAQADILHIATHGLFRPDNPFFSSLKLADGWIDVRALYRLPLVARLVVLSACDSGSGEIRGGDEVIGLARGFLGAGAQDLVVSLWNVHDARAVEFMSRFYQYLTEGMSPAAALQAVQCRFIQQGDHAYYWASFLAIGA